MVKIRRKRKKEQLGFCGRPIVSVYIVLYIFIHTHLVLIYYKYIVHFLFGNVLYALATSINLVYLNLFFKK
jgi:hypothetical protein